MLNQVFQDHYNNIGFYFGFDVFHESGIKYLLETLSVYGDGELICKVLENLLTNAIRYAKTSVTISVTDEKNWFVFQ